MPKSVSAASIERMRTDLAGRRVPVVGTSSSPALAGRAFSQLDAGEIVTTGGKLASHGRCPSGIVESTSTLLES
jgi:hypothetical protein